MDWGHVELSRTGQMCRKAKFKKEIQIQKTSDQKITHQLTNHKAAHTDWLKVEQFLVRSCLDLDFLFEFCPVLYTVAL